MESELHAVHDWLLSNILRFADDFPYTALNALVFGAAIGGFVNWFRRRAFRAQRVAIATEISLLNQTLMLKCCKAAFDAIRTGDVPNYRTAKSAASKFQNELNNYLTDYAAYFSPNQSAMFKSYKRGAEDIAKRLDWGNITDRMAANDRFLIESMDWLFSQDRFGGLLTPGNSRFVTTEALLGDFLRSLGLWRVKKYLEPADAQGVETALILLKAEVERRSGKTLDVSRREFL